MAKKKQASVVHDIGRGDIQDNAMAALVTSKLFKSRVETPKKGKGSYSRKGQGRGLVPYQIVLKLVRFGKALF